jgi:predicted enzyme related to lactoylglutathione lyase
MAGRGVVHFEIPAANVKRAKEFYTKAFGWQISNYPGMNYAMVGTTDSDENGMPKNPGAINGGMLKRQKPVSVPVITIDVEDIDASLKEIKKLGGSVAGKKQAVGDMGFSAYFKDTEGNVVGLWESAR